MTEIRDEAKTLAAEQAWDEGRPCEHCNGDGRLPEGRRVVHCRMGWIGADWDLDGVTALIDRADRVEWIQGHGHDLEVVADGMVHTFGVKRPTATQGVTP